MAKVEDLIKTRRSRRDDFRTIVSNIGVVNDLSSLCTRPIPAPTPPPSRRSSTDDHKISSYEYMDRVQHAIREQFPELRTFMQSGSMVDAVLNTGMPAPIDVQVTSPDLRGGFPTCAGTRGADLAD